MFLVTDTKLTSPSVTYFEFILSDSLQGSSRLSLTPDISSKSFVLAKIPSTLTDDLGTRST